jgi:hypothetical protein
MEKTKVFNYAGEEYNYKIVSFGYTELLIICQSLAGTYAQVYRLDIYSIHQAMDNYRNYLQTKK